MLHLAYKTLPMGFLVFSSQGKFSRKGKERKEKVHSSKVALGFLVFSSQGKFSRKGKERKEKVHSSKVAHSCTIGNKVAFKKKHSNHST
jgi:hypothetical protein